MLTAILKSEQWQDEELVIQTLFQRREKGMEEEKREREKGEKEQRREGQ